MAAQILDFTTVERSKAQRWHAITWVSALMFVLLAVYLWYPITVAVHAGLSARAWYGLPGAGVYFANTLAYPLSHPDELEMVAGWWFQLHSEAIQGYHPIIGAGGFTALITGCVILFTGLLTAFVVSVCCPYDLQASTYGDARYARRTDIQAMGIRHLGVKKRVPQGYVIVLGMDDDGHYLMMQETLTVLCVAPPGTGKTASIAIPTIFKCIENPLDGAPISMLVNDVKPELHKNTSGYRSLYSDIFQIQFVRPDDPSKNIFYPRINILSPTVVPPYGAERDTYVEEISTFVCQEEKGSSDSVWIKRARNAMTGIQHFLIAKCERAKLHDRLVNAFAQYTNDVTRFPQALKRELLWEMERCDYSGPVREQLEDGSLTIHTIADHPIGTWANLPQAWRGQEPSLPMMVALLSETKAEINREIQQQIQRAQSEEEKLRLMMKAGGMAKEGFQTLYTEAMQYNYHQRAQAELMELITLHNDGVASVMMNFDAETSVFRNLGVMERFRAADITCPMFRGRWDSKSKTFRSIVVYVSCTTAQMIAFSKPIGLFVDTTAKWLIENPPNSLRRLRAYYESRDAFDEAYEQLERAEQRLALALQRSPNEIEKIAFLKKQAADLKAKTDALLAQTDKLKAALRLDGQGEPIGPAHVILLLDEFPRLPKLQYLFITPEVGRSAKVCVLMIGQDLAQISERYGPEGVERLFTVSAGKSVLPQNNDKTAERFAKIPGRMTFKKKSWSQGTQLRDMFNRNVSNAIEGRDLINPADLMSMRTTYGPNRHIVIVQDYAKRPIVARTCMYFQSRELKYLIHPDEIRVKPRFAGMWRQIGYTEAAVMPEWAVAARKWSNGVRVLDKYTPGELAALDPQRVAYMKRAAQPQPPALAEAA